MVRPTALIRKVWTVGDVRTFGPSVSANPWGALEDGRDVLLDSQLFDYVRGGAHALIAARRVRCAHGLRADIVGLVSDGDRLTSDDVRDASFGMALAMGADVLAMTTLRPHLARVCERAGWSITGQVLTLNTRAMQ